MVDVLAPGSRITLHEYGEPITVADDDLDLRALESANARWVRQLRLSEPPVSVDISPSGSLTLRAKGVTGIVRVGRTDIEIAPKFLAGNAVGWQQALWRILSTVEGGYVDPSGTSGAQTDEMSLPDLFADMFIDSFLRGAARGLPRLYQTSADAGPVLRGSLDTTRLGPWLAEPWNVPYVTDVLSEDTPIARLLRWGADCLSATVKSPGRARALSQIAGSLSHVGRRPPHILDAQRILLHTQYKALEPARIVCVLLLEGAGVHHAPGVHTLSGFLWNSDVIYENFVFWLCRRAAPRVNTTARKRAVRFGTVVAGSGTRLQTTPDVAFENTDHIPVAVLDAKYKRRGTRPAASDTYQVLTAAHVLGCRRVGLTYPVDANAERTVWSVSSNLGGDNIEMSAVPLNLIDCRTSGGLVNLIDEVADWLSSAPLQVDGEGPPTGPS